MTGIDNSMWPGDMPDPDDFDQQDDWEDDLSSIENFDDDSGLDDLEADSEDDISISADEEE